MEAKDEGWQDAEAKETKAVKVDAQAKGAKATDESKPLPPQEEAPSKSPPKVSAFAMSRPYLEIPPSLSLSLPSNRPKTVCVCLRSLFSQRESVTRPTGKAQTEC